MTDWLLVANEWAAGWGAALWRASWQGGLALGFVYALCRLATGLPADARCWLWRIAYLKLVVALVWSTPIALPILPAETPLSAHWSSEAPRVLGGPGSSADLPADMPAPSAARPTAGLEHSQMAARLAPEPARPSILLLLLVVWAVGATTCGVRVVRQWRRTTRLRRACRPSEDLGAAQVLARLCRRLRLHGTPELLCAEAPGPLVVGVLRSAIVLPAGLAATDAEQEWILAHELAHVKRRDLLWAHLPVFARVLLFFHPLVWLGHREWRLAQEMACDALTLRLTSASAGDYGEMLVKLAARHHARPENELSVARIFEPGTALERRLAMLPFSLGGHRRARTAGGALVAAMLLALAPWRVSAQPAPANAVPTQRPAVLRAPERPRAAQTTGLPAARPQSQKAQPQERPVKTAKVVPTAPTRPAGRRAARAAKPAPAATMRPVAVRQPPPAAKAGGPAPGDVAMELLAAHSLQHPLQALTNNPAATAGDGSGFHAIGIKLGPYTSLLDSLTPGEMIGLLSAERDATRIVLSGARNRVEAGQTTRAELIPLDARDRQLTILLVSAKRMQRKTPRPQRADLYRALTPGELVQYLEIEVDAVLQLRTLKRAQYEAGLLPVTEVAPLEARAQQLEILLRAAQRRAASTKGGE